MIDEHILVNVFFLTYTVNGILESKAHKCNYLKYIITKYLNKIINDQRWTYMSMNKTVEAVKHRSTHIRTYMSMNNLRLGT